MFSYDTVVAFLTLTSMEIVLGIDNIVFIAIVAARLPKHQQNKGRVVGISLALVLRIGLLFSIAWIMSLTKPLFSLLGRSFSGRDLILLLGGLFLLAKATREIHVKLEGESKTLSPEAKDTKTLGSVLVQILLLDIVFSLDSVITAVGMVDEIGIMVAAMVVAVLFMLVSARSISNFVEQHPTIKILALSFLILIGVLLMAEGMGAHISKGYVYFAMAFSLGVEILNMIYRKRNANRES